MFSLEQINRIHDQLGKQATLSQYLKALNAIGVDKSARIHPLVLARLQGVRRVRQRHQVGFQPTVRNRKVAAL